MPVFSTTLLVKSHSFSFLPLHVAIRSAAYNIYILHTARGAVLMIYLLHVYDSICIVLSAKENHQNISSQSIIRHLVLF